jgi:hypothetical protein
MILCYSPLFLQIGSHITYEHKGAYHKGFLARNKCGTYCFSFKTHINKKSEDWGVNISNLPFTWADLFTEGVLLPGHVAHSFIRSSSHDPPHLTNFDPAANIGSTVNLHENCPPSLLQALALTHPDCEVWLQSYYEEKRGIDDMGTFWKITPLGNTELFMLKVLHHSHNVCPHHQKGQSIDSFLGQV